MGMEELAEGLVRATLEGVDPYRLTLKMLEGIEGEWHVLAVGKASPGMARAAREALGERLLKGILIYLSQEEVEAFETVVASHPLPDAGSVEAARRALGLASGLGEGDNLLVLLSGGTSSLMEEPWEPAGLDDVREAYRLMLLGGFNIHETNLVRRHLSRVKGGRLAEAAYPARVLGLVISDVVGNPLHDIGSGPTAPDPTTKEEAINLLQEKSLWLRFPEMAREALLRAPETPKPRSPVFESVRNEILADNELAVRSAALFLRERGFAVRTRYWELKGEAREVGARLAGEVGRLKPGEAVVLGGETWVSVRGDGVGGRCQELALSFALEVKREGAFIVSFSTDGVDGVSPAAGAWATWETRELAQKKGLDPRRFLENNDSYTFFKALGQAIETGPTGSNVADVAVVGVLRP